MSNVVDLLSRRAQRQETVLRFTTAAEALEFAHKQIRDLQAKADTALLINAQELDLPLAQASAVLVECLRIHATREGERGQR